jgi:hypothetical protein
MQRQPEAARPGEVPKPGKSGQRKKPFAHHTRCFREQRVASAPDRDPGGADAGESPQAHLSGRTGRPKRTGRCVFDRPSGRVATGERCWWFTSLATALIGRTRSPRAAWLRGSSIRKGQTTLAVGAADRPRGQVKRGSDPAPEQGRVSR